MTDTSAHGLDVSAADLTVVKTPGPERSPAADRGAPVELRLALVCYGGVSLAVYMHGMTREFHKLVDASRAFDSMDHALNPYDGTNDTRHTYFQALQDMSDAGSPVRATIDVIAGTSAGGINGVCLAKVIARNGSQEALKKLWINEGDLKTLLRSPAILGWRTRAGIAAGRTLLRLGRDWSPLRGERMSGLLYDAIKDMEPATGTSPATLIPDGGSLDLFITMTDLDGFSVRVPTGAGGVSQRETEHAQVLSFRGRAGDDTFGASSLGALAFGARATASFPGAFAPVSLTSFGQELAGRAFDPGAVTGHFQHAYDDPAHPAARAWFVDGGVLDNAPFDLVIDAIAKKRAESEVQRRLVYLQPDPGVPLDQPDPVSATDGQQRGYLAATWHAVVKVKGGHAIMRELLALRDMNVRIAEIGTIADVQMDQVNAAIEAAWQATRTTDSTTADAPPDPWDITDLTDVTAIAKSFHQGAPGFVGAGYTAYCRLKLDATMALLAERAARMLGYPVDSNEATLLQSAIGSWARGQVTWNPLDGEQMKVMLGAADVPYRERRFLFILAGLNKLYDVVGTGPPRPTRGELDELKSRAWTLLEELRAAPDRALGGETIAALGELVSAHPDAAPADFVQDHGALIQQLSDGYHAGLTTILGDGSTPLWQQFAAKTKDWDPQYRRELLSRFIGFPLWDALIFPTIAESRLPQFTPIRVSQFSPLTARALQPPAGAKLKGVSMKHFGGFADPAWRENDYLWGRLDALELILKLVRDTGAATSMTDAGQQRLLGQGHSQILAAEQDLARIADLRTALEQQLK